MSDDQRLAHLEREVNELYESQKSLEKILNEFTVTIALLDQTLRTLKKAQDSKGELNQRFFSFGIGVVISAIVTFIINGGLV